MTVLCLLPMSGQFKAFPTSIYPILEYSQLQVHKSQRCMTHVRMWQVICNQQSVNVCEQIPGYPDTNTIIPGYPYTDTTPTATHSCMLFRRERKVESRESCTALP